MVKLLLSLIIPLTVFAQSFLYIPDTHFRTIFNHIDPNNIHFDGYDYFALNENGENMHIYGVDRERYDDLALYVVLYGEEDYGKIVLVVRDTLEYRRGAALSYFLRKDGVIETIVPYFNDDMFLWQWDNVYYNTHPNYNIIEYNHNDIYLDVQVPLYDQIEYPFEISIYNVLGQKIGKMFDIMPKDGSFMENKYPSGIYILTSEYGNKKIYVK